MGYRPNRFVGREKSDKGAKTKDPLPKSLAYNLMTALLNSARADFHKAAVAGIFEHYFKDTPSPEQEGSETSGGPRRTQQKQNPFAHCFQYCRRTPLQVRPHAVCSTHTTMKKTSNGLCDTGTDQRILSLPSAILGQMP